MTQAQGREGDGAPQRTSTTASGAAFFHGAVATSPCRSVRPRSRRSPCRQSPRRRPAGLASGSAREDPRAPTSLRPHRTSPGVRPQLSGSAPPTQHHRGVGKGRGPRCRRCRTRRAGAASCGRH